MSAHSGTNCQPQHASNCQPQHANDCQPQHASNCQPQHANECPPPQHTSCFPCDTHSSTGLSTDVKGTAGHLLDANAALLAGAETGVGDAHLGALLSVETTMSTHASVGISAGDFHSGDALDVGVHLGLH